MAKKLLIIEDDADMLEYFRIVLSDPAWEILQASNGSEALDLLDRGAQVDVILLDMVMPLMSGEEFFRVLRRDRGSRIPVIFSSVDESRVRTLEEVGPLQGVFLKGRPGRELKDLVRKAVA